MKIKKLLPSILIIAACLAVSSQAQTFLNNGLVAYYPFNGNANDASGNGNNGTIVGGVTLTTDRFGRTNSAYSFNGINGYIDIGQPVGASPSNFTQSAWVAFASQGTAKSLYNTIITQRQQDGDAWATLCLIFTGSATAIPSLIADAPNHTTLCDGYTQIQSNVWSFVCGVYSNGNYQLYINGILENQTSDGLPLNSPDHMYLMHDSAWGTFLNGALGDVRIYNRALSSNEVAALYGFESNPNEAFLTQDLTNIYAVYGQNKTIGVSVSSPIPVAYQWYFASANDAGQAGAYAVTFNNFVVGAVVTNGGYGYGTMPQVSFVGGGGTGASGFGTNINGVVTGIKVTNAGSGYVGLPSVVIDPPNGFLIGQTNSTLTLTNANQNSLGNYFVVVSNAAGSVTSSVVNLTLFYPPAITTTNQLQDQIVNAYSPASFNVAATGTAPLSYQWLMNGSILPGATTSTLTFPSVTPPQLGPYSVIVTNQYGSVTSSVANLYMAPYLKTPFAGVQTYWGQTNTLSVGAWGSGSLVYQWYFNGAAIPDATSSNLVLSSIQFTNAGSYTVVVSSPYGSVTNIAEQVVVNPSNVSLGLFAGVTIQGTVGYTYIIQSTANLSDPNSWVTLTNLTLAAPVQIWDDNSVDVHNGPQKFYRVVPGQ